MSNDEPKVMPRSGTAAYHTLIYTASEAECLEDMVKLMSEIMSAYGVRGCIDVMTEWVCAVEYIIPPIPRFRDLTGAVSITSMTKRRDDVTETSFAAAVSSAKSAAVREGISFQEAFAKATQMGDHLMSTITAWEPHVQEALRAAHQHRHRDPVRAALWRGPGVRERDHMRLRDACAFVYQLAHYPMRAARELELAVRPPDMQALANDRSIPPHLSLVLSPEGELSRHVR